MIQTLDPRPYIVRPGDTLTSIARQAGFTNPLDIYNNPANATLRSHRNNPNLIRPGDRIMIPPTPQMVRQVLQARLDALVALRQQMDALFQKLEAEADQNISKYRKVASAADIAAMLASLGVSLGQLTYKGFSAMRLSGEALEKANAELAKDSLHFAYDPLRDPVLKVTADKLGAHPGTVTLVGKATIEAFLNIQSPLLVGRGLGQFAVRFQLVSSRDD